MPYEPDASLKNVRGGGKLRGEAKRAFIKAFNSCYYGSGTEESRCYKIAWAAAKGVKT